MQAKHPFSRWLLFLYSFLHTTKQEGDMYGKVKKWRPLDPCQHRRSDGAVPGCTAAALTGLCQEERNHHQQRLYLRGIRLWAACG